MILKTILYFGNFEMPDKDASAHRVLNNAKILRKLNYRVVFCGVYKSNSYTDKVMDFDNVPRPYPSNTREWIRDMCSFSHFKRCIEQYDNVCAVIVYDFHALPLVLLKYYCKKRNIKVFGDVTEWYENNFSLNPIKFVKWLDTNIVMRWLFKRLDGIIVISDYLETYYKNSVVKIINIPPLTDIDEKIWNQGCCVPCIKKPSFVYNGTTTKSKDKLDVIIDALSHNAEKEFVFNVYGLTRDDVIGMYPEKKKNIEKLGEKIIFHGFVSHEESIKSLFENSCSLIIRDSTRKNNAGFPTKFVEAITSGVDVIISNISNVSKYKKNGSVIIVNNSAEVIERELSKYISEYSIRKRECLRDTFDYRNWETEFAKIF